MPAQLVLAKDLLPGLHTAVLLYLPVAEEGRELFDKGTDAIYEDYTLMI